MSNHKVIQLPSRAALFYKPVLQTLQRADLPFLIGGSLAMAFYMHLPRRPKDLDIFVRREDCESILSALAACGYRTEVLHGHWLSKAWHDDLFIDFIFSSGNGLSKVDDSWFDQSRKVRFLGLPVRICSPEDIVWSKAFIMDRERFDGADIAHLIRDAGHTFDWKQLLDRFGEHWRLLLTHLLLFRFIYPTERIVPRWLMDELLDRARQDYDREGDPDRLCQGTLLSRDQYLSDIELYGYTDGRVEPNGKMTEQEVNEYTSFIREEQARKEEEHKPEDGEKVA
jgi:hypothetical protein